MKSVLLGALALASVCAMAKEPAFCGGRIADANRYESMNPHFKAAFAFLQRSDLATLKDGRYEIDGSNCWAMVQTAKLTPMTETATVEVHRRYIDIQSPISGAETFGLCTFDPARRDLAFDTEKDYALYDAKVVTKTVPPGEFVIFFPWRDAHAPGHTFGPETTIRKLVIKVRNL